MLRIGDIVISDTNSSSYFRIRRIDGENVEVDHYCHVWDFNIYCIRPMSTDVPMFKTSLRKFTLHFRPNSTLEDKYNSLMQ